MLSIDGMRRYARQIMLPDIGEEGQERLMESSVLVIGAGGLGAAVLSYLAAAGIGRLGIVDDDRVELSNLQRQIIHEEADIGRAKTESAADRIAELNPATKLQTYATRLTEENAAALIAGYDVVADGSDNFVTRFAIASACYHAKRPLISAAISGFEGQISCFTPYLGEPHPCYRCLIPELPPEANNCTEVGVVGPLAGILGSMQALETIKTLLSIGMSLSGTLFHYDGLHAKARVITLPRNPGCVLCGAK